MTFNSVRRTLLLSYPANTSTRRQLSLRPDWRLPQDSLIEEETSPEYNSKDFLPVDPGQHLIEKYQIISKLGWGTTSTVWLARELKR